MSLIKTTSALLLAALFLLTTGCAVTPYNYSALNKSKPRSIVVIPPQNSSVEVNAPYIYLSTISKPLAEKGYYVFPVSVIDNFLKENGLPTPAEMNSIPLEKIREHIGADAVLYVEIIDWGQKYNVISSNAVVNAKLRLVDARTGELLWDAQASAVHSPSNGGGGLIGMLVGAIVNQIAGSMMDITPELSRTANESAISGRERGLLKGPYIQTKSALTQN